MKKVVCLIFVFMFTIVSTSAIQMTSFQDSSSVDLLWETYYESFDQMIQEADLIVQGTVDDQYFALDNLVYTLNHINVQVTFQGTTETSILLLQLGGRLGNIYTPYPHDLPKLNLGQSYILFLKQNGNYYHIMGAGQGYFEAKTRSQSIQALSFYEEEFYSRIEHHDPLRYPTPANGWSYPASACSVSYYITGNVTSNQGSYLRYGIESWNGCSSLYLYETSYGAFADITVSITSNSILNPGAVAIAEHVSARKRNIYIYTDNFSTSNLTNWQTIGAHETGHCIGLSHNDECMSVMASSLPNAESLPQYYDIVTVQEMYP